MDMTDRERVLHSGEERCNVAPWKTGKEREGLRDEKQSGVTENQEEDKIKQINEKNEPSQCKWLPWSGAGAQISLN